MARDVRVVVIDPVERRVYEKIIKMKLKSLQKIVGGPIEGYYGVSHLWPGHAMYLNEEGKLQRPPHYGWQIFGVAEQFVAPGLIFQAVSSADRSATISVQEVESKIVFQGEGVWRPDVARILAM